MSARASAADRLPEALQQAARPPRVLFLSHTGQIGGAEICLLTIVRAFDCDVLLFQSGNLHARLERQGTPVRIARARPDLRAIRRDRGLWRMGPRLAGIAGLVAQISWTARRYDVLYCNSQKSFVLGALAVGGRRVRLVWHLHDILDASHFARMQARLVTGLANWRADRVVAPSRAVADAFVDAGGRADLVAVVPNGVSLPGPAADTGARSSGRRHPDLPEGFVFGIFSRLAPWKGQHVAIEALAQLEGACCLIVGAALFGEGDYARELRVLARQLGVADRIRFLGHREDVVELMRQVDVVVHPSISPEPFGLTVVEAMLAGTPVLASRGGAAAEILDDGRLGGLLPPGNSAALALALEQCRRQPEASAQRATAARRHAELNFSASRMRRDIRRLVLEVAQP